MLRMKMLAAILAGCLAAVSAAPAMAARPTYFQSTPDFFDGFDPDWVEAASDWRIATWLQNGTQMSKDRSRIDGLGHMVQTVLPGEPYRGGSMQTDREFGYGRWIARVRPSHVPGALNSIFMKDWDDLTTPGDGGDGNKFEIDIEFLTHTFGPDTGSVHVAIHRKNQPNFYSENIPLSFNPSDGFHDWGFDVLPDHVVWHVDGQPFATWHTPPGEPIEEFYEFFFNSWTKHVWILGPPDEEAHYLIDQVSFHPVLAYLTGDADGDGDVDAFDLTAVNQHFGATGEAGMNGDADGDGDVDAFDLTAVNQAFGDTAIPGIDPDAPAAAALPEPATLGSFALAALVLLPRRRSMSLAIRFSRSLLSDQSE